MLIRAVSSRLPQALTCSTRCDIFSRCRSALLATYPTRTAPARLAAFVQFKPSEHLRLASSSSSSTRWKARQSRDTFGREARVAGLKSRAAFKLLEINDKYRLFQRGDTVVDLGFAPGSWSHVAVNRTQPGGRVIGIDIIPAQPPRGVSTLQGDFLSPEIRDEVRNFVQDPQKGKAKVERGPLSRSADDDDGDSGGLTEEELDEEGRGLIERERKLDDEANGTDFRDHEGLSQKRLDLAEGRVVNVVLSDMSEPWPQTSSSWIKSVSNPYYRMMNTSGMAFRDHAGSMVS